MLGLLLCDDICVLWSAINYLQLQLIKWRYWKLFLSEHTHKSENNKDELYW
jgi:hypothetical protein